MPSVVCGKACAHQSMCTHECQHEHSFRECARFMLQRCVRQDKVDTCACLLPLSVSLTPALTVKKFDTWRFAAIWTESARLKMTELNSPSGLCTASSTVEPTRSLPMRAERTLPDVTACPSTFHRCMLNTQPCVRVLATRNEHYPDDSVAC